MFKQMIWIIYFTTLSLLNPCISSAESSDNNEAFKLHDEVRAMFTASFNGDVDKVLESSHPNVIAAAGGDKVVKAILKQAYAGMTKNNIRLESLTFPESPVFIESEKRRFAIIPTQSVISMFGKVTQINNFVLGILDKNTISWKYLDGAKVKKEAIKEIFPDFPSTFELPKTSAKLIEAGSPTILIVDYGLYGNKVITHKDNTESLTGKIAIVGDFNLIKETNSIPAEIGKEFGMQYTLKTSPGAKNSLSVVESITFPSGGLTNSDTHVTQLVDTQEQTISVGETHMFTYIMETSWELVPGNWVFQVKQGEKVLAEKVFTVYKQ